MTAGQWLYLRTGCEADQWLHLRTGSEQAADGTRGQDVMQISDCTCGQDGGLRI